MARFDPVDSVGNLVRSFHKANSPHRSVSGASMAGMGRERCRYIKKRFLKAHVSCYGLANFEGTYLTWCDDLVL